MEVKSFISNTLFQDIKGPKEIKNLVTQKIQDFIKNENAKELIIDEKCSSNVRKIAHKIAETYGLIHESRDTETGRELYVAKKDVSNYPPEPSLTIDSVFRNIITLIIDWKNEETKSDTDLSIFTDIRDYNLECTFENGN